MEKRMMDKLLSHGVNNGASDTHFKVGDPPAYRIDGVLKSVKHAALSPSDTKAIASHLLGCDQAKERLAEILEHVYEPAAWPNSFGRLASEPAGGPRNLWDDVDDYDNWSASPPQYEDGSVIPNLAGWRRSVDVDRVNPANLGQTVASDQDVKRIIVTVKRDGVPVASLTAVRTSSGPIDR